MLSLGHVTQGNWTTGETERGTGGTPVQMHLHVAGEQYAYHLFRFSKARPDPLTFDLAPCFTHRRRRNFDFAVSSKGRSDWFLLIALCSVVSEQQLRCTSKRVYTCTALALQHIKVALKGIKTNGYKRKKNQLGCDNKEEKVLKLLHLKRAHTLKRARNTHMYAHTTT